MCGITGLYNYSRQHPVQLTGIKDMVSALNHRGPDECGFLVDRNFGMGMSRLSIIDLSESAATIVRSPSKSPKDCCGSGLGPTRNMTGLWANLSLQPTGQTTPLILSTEFRNERFFVAE